MLTAQQRAAVDCRGRSLLVSAAAGSGKTKVLVERLFSYVEREGADLDDFLIITYTRAAAGELRGKIARALTERLEQEPDNEHLRRQMLRVYRADIKTVDAFCTALLRENCHLLGEDARGHMLRPDFRVLDENEAQTLRERVLARTLDDFYETLTPGGAQLVDTLGAGRDDSALEELVLELHAKLQAQPYEERWLEAQRALWSSAPQQIGQTPYGSLLLAAVRRKARHWQRLLSDAAQEMAENDVLSRKYAPSFLDISEQLGVLAAKTDEGWDAARGVSIAFPRLAPVKDSDGGELKVRMKGLWDGCKAAAGDFAETLSASSAEAAEDLRAMAPAMLALIDLTAEFSCRCGEEKRRRNCADFSDQEHEAIRLLVGEDGTPTELARTVGGRYREIMVDEYQDTNEVQNRIFDAISCKGENLFTVGDVKQSIYRFRLADPRIFLQHYNTWPPLAQAREHQSARLLLSRNFRSRREVLEATNFIFSNVLSEEMGELNYGADEMLHPGAPYADSGGCGTEFHLLDLPVQTGEQRVRASEAEAAFVADYIANMLSSNFAVQDEGTRQLRPVREEDIVILMRSPRTRLFDYRRALEARGLRCAADAGGDFFSALEIAVLISLLQVIDNPRQDVPLISVLRSPLAGFTADELAELRAGQRTGDFYDALLAGGEGEKAAAFLSALAALRAAAAHLSVRELLDEIYRRFHVLGVFGAMPGGAERRENLLALLSLGEDFERAGHRGLFSFVSALREQLESGEAPAPQVKSAGGGVRIMSIHKSKGLEFPVVILSDLARRFSNMDFQSSVLVHPQLGLGPMCVDTRRHIQYPTAARQAIERTLRREAKAEELRVLYVAMTRAKEKLVMVHTQSNAAGRAADLMAVSSCPALPEAVDEGKCMGDWIMLPLLQRSEACALRTLAGQSGGGRVFGEEAPWTVCVHNALDFLTSAPGESGAPQEAPRSPELAVDARALEYEYPFGAETLLPAKLTATQLKGRALDEEIAEHTTPPPRLRSLARPCFLAGKTALTGAERGTAMHLALQYLDFSCPADAQSVRMQIGSPCLQRRLTDEQAEAVDANALVRFLRSPLAARIRASGRVEREYRFSLLRPARDFFAVDSGDAVLLQGVADCFFEEDGALVIVDFKTDRITRAEVGERAERYRPQLEAYSLALARVTEKPVKERVLYFLAVGEEARL